MFYETLQPVLVEGEWPYPRTDHYLRVQMFGRPAQPSGPSQSMLMLAPKRFRWELYGDGFTLAYTVTEIYSQAILQPGTNQIPTAMLYTKSNRVLEDEWPYPKTDHQVINQFRWAIVGILYPRTFEVPDLNDHPWLEWVHPPIDHNMALFPFRSQPVLGPLVQNALVFWKPRFWDVAAEPDIDRQAPHNTRLLFFGITPFGPGVPSQFVMDSMWRADQGMTADTIWYYADGVDIHDGGGVDRQSGLLGEKVTGPITTLSAILPL